MVLPQDSYLRFGPYLDLMTGIRTALKINEGIIKLVAQDGCGKTLFCRELARELKAEGHEVIFFATPPESVDYLHKRIQSELDLPREKNFTRSLTQYLLAKSPPNNKLIIIYDDAEKISKGIFILIRLLNNIHNDSDTLVSQVICGTSQLDRVFDDPDLRSLTQYLNQSFTLAAMTRDEIEDFCSGYLKKSGVTGKSLSSREMTDIFMASKGMPGKTMDLLSRQVAMASTAPSIKEAVQEKEVDMPEPEVPAPAPAREEAATYYAREVDDILNEDTGKTSAVPLYFKLVLSVLVVVSTIVLAVILSGENEAVNSRIAEILADDSPLYLDEVTPAPVTQTNEPAAQIEAEPETLPAPVALPGEESGEDILVATTQETASDDSTSLSPPATLAESASSSIAMTTTPASEEGFVVTSAEQTSDAVMENTEDVLVEVAEPEAAELAEAIDTSQDEEILNTENLVTPSPTPQPVDEPAVDSLDKVINDTIATWIQAWQNGNFAGYIGAYHKDFSATNYESLAAWQDARKPRVDGVAGMTISYDRFMVISEEAEQVTTRFWLDYSRGNYADETLKELVFQRENDGWLIREERNLEINVK